MSITLTTLASAVAAGDLSIRVASATGALTKNVIQIDSEFYTQTATADGVVIPVRGGEQGSYNQAHNAGAVVLMGLASDFPAAPPGAAIPQPMAPSWTVATYTVAGAIAIPTTKQNVYVKLSAGSGIALTLADPTAAQEGQEMLIQAEAAQAYTVSNAAGSGFNAGGAGTDVATFGGAIGDNFHIKAVGTKWNVILLRNVTLG